jgi:hypothetical protein
MVERLSSNNSGDGEGALPANKPNTEAAGPFRGMLESILTGYLDGKNEPFGTSASMYNKFEHAEEYLRQLVQGYPHIQTRFSVGLGKWANVPWLALLDDRVTDSIQRGLYPAYLFSADMTGVYLVLMQGVTDLISKKGWEGAQREFDKSAATIRTEFYDSLKGRFFINSDLDLQSGKGELGSQYEAATIAWVFYEKGLLPNENQLVDDLYTLLQIYEKYALESDGVGGNKAYPQPMHYTLANIAWIPLWDHEPSEKELEILKSFTDIKHVTSGGVPHEKITFDPRYVRDGFQFGYAYPRKPKEKARIMTFFFSRSPEGPKIVGVYGLTEIGSFGGFEGSDVDTCIKCPTDLVIRFGRFVDFDRARHGGGKFPGNATFNYITANEARAIIRDALDINSGFP